jgi:hypothetical protein
MAVEPAHPPAAMMRVGNPVMRGLLRSPAGGPLRKQFMVLRFFGRKTGRAMTSRSSRTGWTASCTR